MPKIERKFTFPDGTFTTHRMFFSSTSCTRSFSPRSSSSCAASPSISFSFTSRALISSAAFFSARARLLSFSCG